MTTSIRSIRCNRQVASFNKNEPDRPDLPSEYHLPKEPLELPPGPYIFEYSYPMSRGATKLHHLDGEVTAFDILDFAAQDYKLIYLEEDRVVGKPTDMIPGMLNRDRSNGPYGIWGHVIQDLWFERINIDVENKNINFNIGS